MNPILKTVDAILCVIAIIWSVGLIIYINSKPYNHAKIKKGMIIEVILASLVLVVTLLATTFT